MKLFTNLNERSAVTTVLAGALIIADVVHRGLPSGDETAEMRDLRIGKAFALASQFLAIAEKMGEQ